MTSIDLPATSSHREGHILKYFLSAQAHPYRGATQAPSVVRSISQPRSADAAIQVRLLTPVPFVEHDVLGRRWLGEGQLSGANRFQFTCNL
jgi:hypothetical protein